MRIFTVLGLGLCSLMAMPATAADVTPRKMMQDAKSRLNIIKEGKENGNQPRKVRGGAKKISELAAKMKPGVMKTYDRYGEKWRLDDSYTYVYDAEGNVIVENLQDAEGDYARTASEYDVNNKVTFKETRTSRDGVNFQNYKKTVFAYDPIVTGVIAQRTEWMWMGDDWQLVGNNYKRIIVRNEEGNVKSVVIAVLFNGIYDPTQRIDITYGEDGKATSISEQILAYDGRDYYWEQGVEITDIVWERTDGQIWSVDELFIGNNRIGSARYIDSDDMDMNVTVEYEEDSDAYTASMAMTMDGMSATAVSKYTPLENDGYISEGTTYFMGNEVYSSREEYRRDDWGLMTLSYDEETEDGEVYWQKAIGDVEYDGQGMPLTYTIREVYPDESTGEEVSEYVIRAEYSDYVDVTGGVSSEIESGLQERCYDLNGMPVSSEFEGIVIKDRKAVRVRK